MTLAAVEESALELLASRPLVVLTGAGLSTDSGIPDYRGPGSPARAPMTYQEFVATPEAQQRYWARSHLGWQRMGRAVPNDGHRALAALDPRLLITQNVDGLHEAAGSREVVALHGRVADVICLVCRTTSSRARLQERLEELNPGWLERHASAVSNPDGDVDLDETADFVVPRLPVRRSAQAARRVLRGERPGRAGGPLLRGGRGARHGRGAAGRRVVADGHERAAVRQARGGGRHADRHREPGADPRRRAGDVQARGGVQRVPGRACQALADVVRRCNGRQRQDPRPAGDR